MSESVEAASKFLQGHNLVDEVNVADGLLEVTLKEGVKEFDAMPGELIEAGYRFKRFAEKETNLESAFMALTKGSGSKI